MDTNAISFQIFLKTELDHRISRNSSYSVRAFARDLNINDSTLSKLLVGKIKFTEARVKKIGNALKLSAKQIEQFVLTLNSRYKANIELDYKQIQNDQFECASNWYYDAIIELTKIKKLELTPKRISELLSITLDEATLAVERLLRLEMILKNNEGKFVCNQNHSLTSYDEDFHTNSLLKKYQKQILQKSIQAIDDIPRGERSHNSMILSVDSNRIKDFHNLLRKQQQELLTFMEENSVNANNVYAIQFSSFPLTKSESK